MRIGRTALLVSAAAMAAVCCLQSAVAQRAPRRHDSDVSVNNLYYPITDENGLKTRELFGETVTALPNNDIVVTNLVVVLYGPAEVKQIVFGSAKCLYKAEEGIVTSRSPVVIEHTNAVITGTGFCWREGDGVITIHKNARLVLRGINSSAALVATGRQDTAAAPGEGTNIVVVTSDQMTFDYATRKVVFIGNVRVVDGETTIYAERIEVVFDQNDIAQKIVAEGNVRMVQGEWRASCVVAMCVVQQGLIVMFGEARMERSGEDPDDPEYVEGDTIKLYREQDRLICTPATLHLSGGRLEDGSGETSALLE
jgi:lipopolysaccharide transport protein LptA